jgi:replicative DNA helicase
VFEAMRNLETAQQPIDVVTLEAEIAKRGKSDSIGGIAFLGELALRVPTVENVIAYAGS